MWRRRDFRLSIEMKCLNCGKPISDWRLLKSVGRGIVECENCGQKHGVTERGIGLDALMSLMGVTAAVALSLLFLVIEVNAVIPALVLLAVMIGVFKLAMKWGVKLSLDINDVKPAELNKRERAEHE